MSDPADREPDAIFEQFGSLLGDLFAGGSRTAARSRDVRQTWAISRREARGAERMVPVDRFVACAGCRGPGGAAERELCDRCGGRGGVIVTKKLRVRIPAGVRTGKVLRLRGQGNEVAGETGDLYLVLEVEGDAGQPFASPAAAYTEHEERTPWWRLVPPMTWAALVIVAAAILYLVAQ